MIDAQEHSNTQSLRNGQKLLSLVYPTYKRPSRVERLLNHYSKIDNPFFEIVLSNNDKSVCFERQYQSCDKFIFVDNLKSSRGGDNAINGIRASSARYCVLMSDEDILIGLSEICSWLLREPPSLFLLPVINQGLIERSFTPAGHFSDFHFDSYISGMGFASSLVTERTCSDIIASTNNDYVHIMLAISILSSNKNISMPKYSYVVREEVYHEGKESYFAIRHECFGWQGRSLQRRSLFSHARSLGDSALLSFANKVLHEGVFIGCFTIYGVRRTLREAAAIGELQQALTIFVKYCLRFFFINSLSKLFRLFKNSCRNILQSFK